MNAPPFAFILASCVFLNSVFPSSAFSSSTPVEEKPLKLTLEFCQQSAKQNSNVLLQKQSLRGANQAHLSSLQTRYFPQLELNALASWQSEVTTLPAVPGFNVAPLAKDQYRVSMEFQQLLYDGSRLSAQKQIQNATHEIELKQADIALFQLKTQVLQTFLEILFLEKQENILKTLQADLALQQKKLQTQLAAGIALKNHVDTLDAEILKTEQSIFKIQANRQTAIKVLSEMIGKEIPLKAVFVTPEREDMVLDTNTQLHRPELGLFQAQIVQGDAQKNQMVSKTLPQLSLNASLAYGRPGFNFLKNNFDVFGIVGLRLHVPLTEWWAMSHQKNAIVERQKAIQAQKSDFESTQHRELIRLKEAQKTYEALILSDDEIIQKRKNISQRTAQALSNGTVTPNDYILDLNAEKQAMLNQKLHKLLRLQAILTFEHISGGG